MLAGHCDCNASNLSDVQSFCKLTRHVRVDSGALVLHSDFEDLGVGMVESRNGRENVNLKWKLDLYVGFHRGCNAGA